MKFFTRQQDPFDNRSHALSREIARLEAEIETLSRSPAPAANARIADATQDSSEAAGVATAIPRPSRASARPGRSKPAAVSNPMPTRARSEKGVETPAADPHFNDLGVRKYDLVSAWSRLLAHLAGPPSSNPKMVQFLAAGSIQGLRPLRYEKRVARNRFLALLALLLLVLWGLAYWAFKH